MLRPMIRGSRKGFRDAFEEAGILDNVDSTLVIAEGYRDLPPVLVRTFVHDSISRLDDFAREYRGYVGKVMDYVCEELRDLLYEALRRAASEVSKVEEDVHCRVGS